jgi:hypothetical protein
VKGLQGTYALLRRPLQVAPKERAVDVPSVRPDDGVLGRNRLERYDRPKPSGSQQPLDRRHARAATPSLDPGNHRLGRPCPGGQLLLRQPGAYTRIAK